jgi:hypothetical protein
MQSRFILLILQLVLMTAVNALFAKKSIQISALSDGGVIPFQNRNFSPENWIQNAISKLKNQEISYDNRVLNSFGRKDEVTSYECQFHEFLEIINESDFDDSIYFMSETILESIQSTLTLKENIFEPDLFQYFPNMIQPKLALVIGGEGARSFLHRDPYDWSGWNYLFEGRKYWAFLPDDIDESLIAAQVTPVDAWNMDLYDFAMGQRSDTVNLFRLTEKEQQKLGVMFVEQKEKELIWIPPGKKYF